MHLHISTRLIIFLFSSITATVRIWVTDDRSGLEKMSAIIYIRMHATVQYCRKREVEALLSFTTPKLHSDGPSNMFHLIIDDTANKDQQLPLFGTLANFHVGSKQHTFSPAEHSHRLRANFERQHKQNPKSHPRGGLCSR